jgi:hypothetical protein
MKRLHDLSAAIAMLLFLCASSSHAAMLTDLWWQPGESGWGANVVHQDDVAFVTLFD